jgi:hypothetical protein
MNRVEDLAELREQLKVWMDDAPVDRKAALVAQYRATLAEIDELSPKKESGDTIDEIAARRAARRPSAAAGKGRSERTS